MKKMQFMSKLMNSPAVESNRIFHEFLSFHAQNKSYEAETFQNVFPFIANAFLTVPGSMFVIAALRSMPFLDLHHLAVDMCGPLFLL